MMNNTTLGGNQIIHFLVWVKKTFGQKPKGRSWTKTYTPTVATGVCKNKLHFPVE